MSQTPQQPPVIGQVANGYRWDGTQWIPLPQVGQIVNGHQWNGTQWIPLPQVGQIVNGHQWNGTQWVPLPAGPAQAPVAQPGSTSGAPDRHAAVIGQIAAFAQAWQLSFDQVGDRITLTRVVAERKAFLSTARLEYLATITLDAAGGEIRFSEMLKESGAGLTSGGGDDGDFGSTTGFGFQKTSYNTRTDTIADSIEEQARSLGAKYANQFPYHEIRTQLNRIAEAGGYGFRYGVR